MARSRSSDADHTVEEDIQVSGEERGSGAEGAIVSPPSRRSGRRPPAHVARNKCAHMRRH